MDQTTVKQLTAQELMNLQALGNRENETRNKIGALAIRIRQDKLALDKAIDILPEVQAEVQQMYVQIAQKYHLKGQFTIGPGGAIIESDS